MAESQAEKLHAACDECRARKLKCSGETPRCNRCERESIRCVYSPQKPMGRPRKRRREDGETAGEAGSETTNETGVSNPEATVLEDFGLISHPDFADFAGLIGFPGGLPLVSPPATHHHQAPPLTNGYNHEAPQHPGFALDVPIEPSLSNHDHTASTSNSSNVFDATQAEAMCTCLSMMYLALSDLHTMPTFAFPAVISTQRQAMATAKSIMDCERCYKQTFTALQNTQSLSALLIAIAERFHRILDEIDAQAEDLARKGEKKSFRMGDTDPALRHLHTGTIDCPMGFNILMDAKDWKTLAKKVVKTEVLGGGSNPNSLSALLDHFQKRQERWHTSTHNLEERARMFGAHATCNLGEAHCLRIVSQVQTMVTNMNWD